MNNIYNELTIILMICIALVLGKAFATQDDIEFGNVIEIGQKTFKCRLINVEGE